MSFGQAQEVIELLATIKEGVFTLVFITGMVLGSLLYNSAKRKGN